MAEAIVFLVDIRYMQPVLITLNRPFHHRHIEDDTYQCHHNSKDKKAHCYGQRQHTEQHLNDNYHYDASHYTKEHRKTCTSSYSFGRILPADLRVFRTKIYTERRHCK